MAAAPRYCNLCRGRCLHRPGEPRGVAGSPGRDKSRPYKPSETTDQTGTAAATRVAVGRDALIPPDPAAAQGYDFEIAKVRRAKSPALRNEGKHGGQPGKRCGANTRGRAMALPYKPGGDTRPPGKPQTAQHRIPLVGADSISARSAAARTPAGGINPAPTNKFYVLGQPGRPRPRVIATSVGDDARIVPGTSRRRERLRAGSPA